MRALQPVADPQAGLQESPAAHCGGNASAQGPVARRPRSPAIAMHASPAEPGADAGGARAPDGSSTRCKSYGFSRAESRVRVLALREGECGNSDAFAPDLLSKRVVRAFADAAEMLERNVCQFCRVEAGERDRVAAAALCRALGPRAAWSPPCGSRTGNHSAHEIPVLLSVRVPRAGGRSRACPAASAALAPSGADSSCSAVDVLARLIHASAPAAEGASKALFSLELRLKGPVDLRAAERAAAERGVAAWALAAGGPRCPAASDFIAAHKAHTPACDWRTARRMLRRCGLGSRPPQRTSAPSCAFALAAELRWTRLDPASGSADPVSHRAARCVMLPSHPGLDTSTRWHAVVLREPDAEEATRLLLARAMAAPALAEAEAAVSRQASAQERRAIRFLFPAADASSVGGSALSDAASRLERTYTAFAAYEGYSAWRGAQVPALRLRSARTARRAPGLCLGPMAAVGVATESQRCLALSHLQRQRREMNRRAPIHGNEGADRCKPHRGASQGAAALDFVLRGGRLRSQKRGRGLASASAAVPARVPGGRKRQRIASASTQPAAAAAAAAPAAYDAAAGSSWGSGGGDGLSPAPEGPARDAVPPLDEFLSCCGPDGSLRMHPTSHASPWSGLEPPPPASRLDPSAIRAVVRASDGGDDDDAPLSWREMRGTLGHLPFTHARRLCGFGLDYHCSGSTTDAAASALRPTPPAPTRSTRSGGEDGTQWRQELAMGTEPGSDMGSLTRVTASQFLREGFPAEGGAEPTPARAPAAAGGQGMGAPPARSVPRGGAGAGRRAGASVREENKHRLSQAVSSILAPYRSDPQHSNLFRAAFQVALSMVSATTPGALSDRPQSREELSRAARPHCMHAVRYVLGFDRVLTAAGGTASSVASDTRRGGTGRTAPGSGLHSVDVTQRARVSETPVSQGSRTSRASRARSVAGAAYQATPSGQAAARPRTPPAAPGRRGRRAGGETEGGAPHRRSGGSARLQPRLPL